MVGELLELHLFLPLERVETRNPGHLAKDRKANPTRSLKSAPHPSLRPLLEDFYLQRLRRWKDPKAFQSTTPITAGMVYPGRRTVVPPLGSMPLMFLVSVKKQQPEPSVCQLRDLQNVLTVLNTHCLCTHDKFSGGCPA